MLGLLCKRHGAQAVADAIARCAAERPLEPVAWLQAALKTTKPAPKGGTEPAWRTAERERAAGFLGPYATKPQGQQTIIDMEADDAAPRALG